MWHLYFPTGNYSVEVTWYFHHKDVVEVQLPKNPLHFSTVVVSAVLRQTGMGVSREDVRLYFLQHTFLEEHGVCFDEHAVLAPPCERRSPKRSPPSLQLNIIASYF